MDNPLYKYIDGKGHIIVEDVPLQDLVKAFDHFGHCIKDGYVFGIKLVSREYMDMYCSNTYEEGKTYHFEDSDQSPFSFYRYYSPCYCGTAGLWSYGLIKDLVITSLERNKNNTLCHPILVKYPIQTTIPEGEILKGKEMIVVQTDINVEELWIDKRFV